METLGKGKNLESLKNGNVSVLLTPNISAAGM